MAQQNQHQQHNWKDMVKDNEQDENTGFEDTIDIRLSVVQQPLSARCSGKGTVDLRSVDPPPVIQLSAELNQIKS
ncbi:hypothetical protein BC833DRAFT_626463 [Globomyces pollinis-pini]|nr:hypothetical protein BC833DRAFT_626463 [Globomyces pollinis-pini]